MTKLQKSFFHRFFSRFRSEITVIFINFFKRHNLHQIIMFNVYIEKNAVKARFYSDIE